MRCGEDNAAFDKRTHSALQAAGIRGILRNCSVEAGGLPVRLGIMVLSQKQDSMRQKTSREALVKLGDIARCLEHESPSAIKSKQWALGECGSDVRGKGQEPKG